MIAAAFSVRDFQLRAGYKMIGGDPTKLVVVRREMLIYLENRKYKPLILSACKLTGARMALKLSCLFLIQNGSDQGERNYAGLVRDWPVEESITAPAGAGA